MNICREILLIKLWPLYSVRNKYQKYFLKGKGDQCEGLTILPSSSVFAIFSAYLIWPEG